MKPTKHIPVLLQESLASLQIKPGGVYVDCTLGGGGHSLKILGQMQGKGKLVTIDQDQEAIKRFADLLKSKGFEQKQTNIYRKQYLHVALVNANFDNLTSILKDLAISEVDGILADLGLSSDQLEDDDRGFSFQKEAELDMRMNTNSLVRAKDLVNALYEKELVKLFSNLGEVSFAKRLAREIIQTRKQKPITTTTDLKQIVQKIVPFGRRQGANKHPEAKVFQALRIAINNELHSLNSFLPQALESLSPGGRLVVISFHSGEDRIVKNFIRQAQSDNLGKIIGELIRPLAQEVEANPRSHSAKLRVFAKL